MFYTSAALGSHALGVAMAVVYRLRWGHYSGHNQSHRGFRWSARSAEAYLMSYLKSCCYFTWITYVPPRSRGKFWMSTQILKFSGNICLIYLRALPSAAFPCFAWCPPSPLDYTYTSPAWEGCSHHPWFLSFHPHRRMIAGHDTCDLAVDYVALLNTMPYVIMWLCRQLFFPNAVSCQIVALG